MTKINSHWDKALRYISFRPRTEFEVRKYLGFNCTEEIISRLKELKFIDDSEYAKSYIVARSSRSPRSAKILQLELKRRGINLVTSDYSMIINDEIDLAKRALDKKLKTLKNLSPRELKLKSWRFLMTRGFSSSIIEKTLDLQYNDSGVN